MNSPVSKSRTLNLPPLPTGWCTYILICVDNCFYIGLTDDLSTRIRDHASGKGGTYTKSVKPTLFVWYESHTDRPSAAQRERQLKTWSHAKKQKLAQHAVPFDFGQNLRLSLLSNN